MIVQTIGNQEWLHARRQRPFASSTKSKLANELWRPVVWPTLSAVVVYCSEHRVNVQACLQHSM